MFEMRDSIIASGVIAAGGGVTSSIDAPTVAAMTRSAQTGRAGTFASPVSTLPPAAASRSEHFLSDWYERVWVFGGLVDLGSIPDAGASVPVIVWNAHLDQRWLTSVAIQDGEGVGVGVAAPNLFKRLEYREIAVTATAAGPIDVDATIALGFGSEIVTLRALGVRATIWPFAVDWSGGGVRVTLEYKTEIMRTRAGREKRQGLRSQPRKTLAFSSLVHHANFGRWQRFSHSWLARPILVPDPTLTARTSADAQPGYTTIVLDELPTWVAAGRTLILSQSRDRPLDLARDAVTVDGVAGLVVTLRSPLRRTWRAGAAVSPALRGILDDQRSVEQPTNEIGKVAVAFSVTPGSEGDPQLSPVEDIFEGREVLLIPPDWSNGVSITIGAPRETVDYGRGRIETTTPVKWAQPTVEMTYLGRDAAQMRRIESFWRRRKGRLGEFWLPGTSNDMTAASDLIDGGYQMRIEGDDIRGTYAASETHRAIALMLVDGSRLYRRITSMVTDAGDTLLTLAEPWLRTIAPIEIARISWLTVQRLGSDQVVMDWVTDTKGRAKLAAVTLDDRPSEVV
jgi:hypothetical protein